MNPTGPTSNEPTCDERERPQRRISQPEIPLPILMDWLNCVPTFEQGQGALDQWQQENPRLPDREYDADMAAWILEHMAHQHTSGTRADLVAGLFTQAVSTHMSAEYAVTLTADNNAMYLDDAAFDVAIRLLLHHAKDLGVTVTITMTDPEHLDPKNRYITNGTHTTTLEPLGTSENGPQSTLRIHEAP